MPIFWHGLCYTLSMETINKKPLIKANKKIAKEMENRKEEIQKIAKAFKTEFNLLFDGLVLEALKWEDFENVFEIADMVGLSPDIVWENVPFKHIEKMVNLFKNIKDLDLDISLREIYEDIDNKIYSIEFYIDSLEAFELLEENGLNIDFAEFLADWDEDKNDHELGNFRLIDVDEIDKIQQEELESDLYILGCFDADFMSRIIGLDGDIIKALQQADKYEVIGEHAKNYGHIETIQQEYVKWDGYGHHFAYYDHNEHELEIDGVEYLAFRTN